MHRLMLMFALLAAMPAGLGLVALLEPATPSELVTTRCPSNQDANGAADRGCPTAEREVQSSPERR